MFIGDKKSTNVLISSDHGLMIANRFDTNEFGTGHGQWLFDHGNACTIEADQTIKSLRYHVSPIILDIGANIGCYTSLVAKLIPSSTVYAFEPQRHVFQMLSGNMAINNHMNVHTVNCAIGDYDGMIQLDEPDPTKACDFGTYSITGQNTYTPSGNKRWCDIMTVDSFVAKYHIERVDFIKIDVEGMDIQVLEGAAKTIEQFKPGLLIEHITDYGSISDQLRSHPLLQGYDTNFDQRNALFLNR